MDAEEPDQSNGSTCKSVTQTHGLEVVNHAGRDGGTHLG